MSPHWLDKMKIIKTLTLILFVPLLSCSDRSEKDSERLTASAREYFFLDDSIDVLVDVVDTLHIDELETMLETIEENQRLIQLDIDTLGSMIDEINYPTTADLEIGNDQKIKLLQYQLKYQQLQAKQKEFVQNERVFLALKRASWADIAGFNVEVRFDSQGSVNSLLVLMDGNYRIVD